MIENYAVLGFADATETDAGIKTQQTTRTLRS